MPAPYIHRVFDYKSRHYAFIVADPVTECAAVINPILNFDPQTNRLSTSLADCVLAIVESEGYSVTYILETGIHTRHISSCRYLQDKLTPTTGLRPNICIGRNLDRRRGSPSPISPDSTSSDDRSPPRRRFSVQPNAFDHLFQNAETFRIGNILASTMNLSTTPTAGSAAPTESIAYVIGEHIFTGIPGGLASLETESQRKLLGFSPEHRVYGIPFVVTRKSEAFLTVGQLYNNNQYQATTAVYTDGEDTSSGTVAETETDGRAMIEFYAMKINARGGRIPRKVGYEEMEVGSASERGSWTGESMRGRVPRPLEVPRGLGGLMC